MIIVGLALAVAYLAVVTVMGVRADRRLGHLPRLPMQWGLDGRPSWTAPRRAALVAVPLLAGAGVFVSTVLLVVRPEGANVPAAAIPALQGVMALVGIGVYAGFLGGAGRGAHGDDPPAPD